MRVHVSNDLGDLTSDMRVIVKRAPADMYATVRDGIRAGNELAKDNARRKNGPRSHARKYPGTFTASMGRGFRGAEVSLYSGEYGPTNRGQGGLAPILENGSRSGNAPQHNLAKSADAIGPSFAQEVRGLPDRWFWPND